MTREEFINGLREVARFLERHPEMPTPTCPLTVNVFVDTKEELAALARFGPWQKKGDDNYFYFTRDIGALSYDVNINRKKICHRVVVGTEVVPAQPEKIVEKVQWVCVEPLLAVQS